MVSPVGAAAGAFGAEAPLHAAARGGQVAVIAFLVDGGAGVNELTADSGATPLWLAAAGFSPLEAFAFNRCRVIRVCRCITA